MTLRAPLTFQLYSARKFPPLEEQLRVLAEIGYTGVQPFGAQLADADRLARGLADNHLTALSAHVGLDQLIGDFDGTLARVETLGIETIIAPYLPPEEQVKDVAGWKATGALLAGLAERIAARGRKFAWHNHAFEFVRLGDGSHPIEHLLGGPETGIGFEVDAAWITRGGQYPEEWIERYFGRVASFHAKDIAPAGQCEDEDGWADAGYGVLDLASLWKAASAAGATMIVAEHDNPSDYVRFARRSAETLKALPGVA